MPSTTLLSIDQYPADGWPSGWGGQFAIRPGGMGVGYFIETFGATGNAAFLNDGLIAFYENGTVNSNLYVTDHTMPLGADSTRFRFTNWNHAAQTVEIQLVYFFHFKLLPIQWVQFSTIAIPTPRLPFSIGIPPGPPLGYPATIPNAVTLTPLNQKGVLKFSV